MTAKLLALVHSKIALAVIGVVLVGGSGAAVAAATHGQLNLASSSAAQATHTPGHDSGNDADSHAHTVSIEGKLTAYDSNGKTISVQARDAKSATTIKVDANTRVNGEHASSLADLTNAIGHDVQVQADKQSDGSLLAWKVTVEGTDSGNNSGDNHGGDGGDNGGQASQHAAIAGTVASVDTGSSSFTVKLADGTTKTVTVSSSTEFEGSAHHLADLKAGMRVAVQGTSQSNGTIAAAQVEAIGE